MENKIRVSDVLNDPCVSDWTKMAIRTQLQRDPVDALNDAELLVIILKQNLVRIQAMER